VTGGSRPRHACAPPLSTPVHQRVEKGVGGENLICPRITDSRTAVLVDSSHRDSSAGCGSWVLFGLKKREERRSKPEEPERPHARKPLRFTPFRFAVQSSRA
jgi:hypothetical protein